MLLFLFALHIVNLLWLASIDGLWSFW